MSKAHNESRKLRVNLECLLRRKIFEKIVTNCGTVTIDPPYSRVDCKINQYYPYTS